MRHRVLQDGAAGKAAEDSKLSEFLCLMRPGSKRPTYANSEAAPVVQPTRAKRPADGAAAPAQHHSGPPEPAPDAKPAQGADQAGSGDSDADTFASNLVRDEEVSDLEYLRRKKRAAASHDGRAAAALPASAEAPAPRKLSRKKRRLAREQSEAAKAANAATKAAAAAAAAPGAPPSLSAEEAAAQIAETGRLFIRNLPFVTTDDDILELFAPHGPVTDATVVKSKVTGASKGFAVVTFASAADALQAFQALDSTIFQGRLLHVLPGKALRMQQDASQAGDITMGETAHQGVADGAASHPVPQPSLHPSAPASAAAANNSAHASGVSSFKAAREAQRKSQAGNRKAWSTLYMRDDTVAEAAAAIMGVSKADLVGADAESAAVQAALAEAQVCSGATWRHCCAVSPLFLQPVLQRQQAAYTIGCG